MLEHDPFCDVDSDHTTTTRQSTQALRLLSRELASLTRSPPEGVRVRFDEDNLLGSVEGLIEGPGTSALAELRGDLGCYPHACHCLAGTPYAGGYFKVRFDIVDVDFPNMPPKCESVAVLATCCAGR